MLLRFAIFVCEFIACFLIFLITWEVAGALLRALPKKED